MEHSPRVRVTGISVSIDGYAAGPNQSLEDPLGVGAERLHEWLFETRFGRQMSGEDGGEAGIDDAVARQGFIGVGASILGRNMFGPIRGPWPDDEWKGWWGDEPPYHHDVFVLTHHARDPQPMAGGTTFHFVTDGPDAALERALAAADGQDVRIYGGASTIQQYLRAGQIDDLHFAVVPVFLGAGERLFDELGTAPDGYECTELVASSRVVHVRFRRRT